MAPLQNLPNLQSQQQHHCCHHHQYHSQNPSQNHVAPSLTVQPMVPGLLLVLQVLLRVPMVPGLLLVLRVLLRVLRVLVVV